MKPSNAGRKLQAMRKTFAGGPRLSNSLCSKCKNNQIAVTNRSGICRECQRKPKSLKSL